MLSWAPSSQEPGLWEIYIPGSTLKGAFRKRASQVLKTLWGETRKTQDVIDRLFGKQRQRGLVFFSDAYLSNPLDPERAWCSMDGIKMDPKSGRPLAQAKADYLFAYGSQLVFHIRLDLQDIDERDLEALAVLNHLLQDFQRGDIPLGGEKTAGFGWVQAEMAGLTWLNGDPNGISQELFGGQPLSQEGIWHKLTLEGDAAVAILQATPPLTTSGTKAVAEPPRAQAGFISHRSFGGYCGTLAVEAEVLTPASIHESGQPSFTANLEDGLVNGWDFFSMSPPAADKRPDQKTYALPSKSIKGMLRHVYAIASDSAQESKNIEQLNPVDALFGWVGRGPNQSLMGRVSFGFGLFDDPQLAWFKVPYPYGEWRWEGGQWQKVTGNTALKIAVANTWRLFPHAPLAPTIQQNPEFQPNTAQASYIRAILPNGRARFTIRFWNLTEEELQRLTWCVTLEDNLAHKIGAHRYLGFGSLRLHITPESFLIDWGKRYAGKPQSVWQLPFKVEQWSNPKVVLHRQTLHQALNANAI